MRSEKRGGDASSAPAMHGNAREGGRKLPQNEVACGQKDCGKLRSWRHRAHARARETWPWSELPYATADRRLAWQIRPLPRAGRTNTALRPRGGTSEQRQYKSRASRRTPALQFVERRPGWRVPLLLPARYID